MRLPPVMGRRMISCIWWIPCTRQGSVLSWTGSRRTSRRTPMGCTSSMDSPCMNIRMCTSVSTHIGEPASLILGATRSNVSSSRTPCSGSRNTMWMVCASMRSLPCSTSTMAARTGSGCPMSTAGGKTLKRSRFSRSSIPRC